MILGGANCAQAILEAMATPNAAVATERNIASNVRGVRDPFLNRIRSRREVVEFMTQFKPRCKAIERAPGLSRPDHRSVLVTHTANRLILLYREDLLRK